MTQERYDRFTTDLKKVDTLKTTHKFYDFIKLFAQQKYLRLGDIEAMLLHREGRSEKHRQTS